MTASVAGPFQFSEAVVANGVLQVSLIATEPITNVDLTLASSAIQWDAKDRPPDIESANAWTLIHTIAEGQMTLSGYRLQPLDPGQKLFNLKVPISTSPASGIELSLKGEYNDPPVSFAATDLYLPTAYLGTLQRGTDAAETLLGSTGADTLLGGNGNDSLQGGLSDDLLDGQGGIDTASYQGDAASYRVVTASDGSTTVTFIGPTIAIYPPPLTEGTDTLRNIERIQFADQLVTIQSTRDADSPPSVGPFTFTDAKLSAGVLSVTVAATTALTNFDLRIGFKASEVLDKGQGITVAGIGSWTVIGSAQGSELAMSGYSLQASTANQPLVTIRIPVQKNLSDGVSLRVDGGYNDPVQVLAETWLVLEPKPSTQSLKGVVQDGYVAGATIYLDANGNGLADPEERTGLTTDEQGRFSGTVVGEGALIAVGGINTDTGLANALPLGAPSGSAVISPLTTLVQQVVKSTGVGTLEASAAVAKALGLPSAVDLLQFDPLASPQESAAVAVQRANVQVATTISIAGTSVVESLASEIVTRSASSTILDLSSAATLSKLAPAVSAGVIQSLSDANATIKSAPGIVQIAQSQKAALIASGRAGTESDDRLTGDAGDDQLSAGKGKDKLQGGAGSDKLDGGDGIDTAIFEKVRSAYKTEKFSQDGITLWKVTDLATGDVDELRNIEKLEFAKASVAGFQNLVQTEVTLDVAGTPAVAYRLYKAAFARDPDLGGLGYWISALEQYLNPNLSPEKNPFLLDVAKTFVESPEFKAKYGADVDNATYIRNLYKNALGRDPLIPDPITGKTDEGYTYWVGVLDAKAASRSDLFVYFSESTENKAAIAPIIATGVEYVPWVPPGG
jgi:Ca2+-binding RTX toxin-like protein